MKVLFLQDDFPPQSFGGAGISTYELALGMKRAGHEVFVITTCRKAGEAGEQVYNGLRVFKIASDYDERWRAFVSLYNRPVVRQIEEILKEVKPDVVQANNIHYYLSYHSLKVARKYSRAVFFTARDTMAVTYGKLETKRYLEHFDYRVSWLDNLRVAGKRWNPFRNLIIRHYLKYADKIFAISLSIKKALKQNKIGNVELIYNGIDFAEWKAADNEVMAFKKKYGLVGKKVMLFSGRLSPAKGSGQVAKALALVKEKIPEAVLLVAGTGQMVGENIIFTGWLERNETKLAYAAADVVLMPSIYLDAFGRVNIEAMAAKKPVIGTCYGGTPEVTVDGVTGYIVNPLHPAEIAEKAIDLLQDPKKAKSFGQAGYERATTKFNLDDKVREYLSVYQTVLQKRAKSSSTNKGTVLVVFGKNLPKKIPKNVQTVLSGPELETLIDPGSVYEAGTLLEEISKMVLPEGSRIIKSFIFQGYELWWLNYNNIFRYFCSPYTEYRRLLEHLREFPKIIFYRPPYASLFDCYLSAYGCEVDIVQEHRWRSWVPLSPGHMLQVLLTLAYLPILMLKKYQTLVFTGDKFEQNHDYDARMKFIYEELRQRHIPFVEFIRSLESWKTVLLHALKRKRPVIYSEGVVLAGRWCSILSGDNRRANQRFGQLVFHEGFDPDKKFKLLMATHYLRRVYDEVWGIRIMVFILKRIGVKAAFITAATERNFQTVLACKLNAIPTVGILHGVASRYSTPYDFLTGFEGGKMLSVDGYGVWSEWWRNHYVEYSDAYKPEQIFVSGPMRPLKITNQEKSPSRLPHERVRVLFISEPVAAQGEVLPYLLTLLKDKNIELTIKFRPYRDEFEEWLLIHEPQVLKEPHLRVVRGSMQEAIQNSDIVVGTYSTAVLEALLQLKTPIFFRTKKWGDYYRMTESDKTLDFFAESPEELMAKIQQARFPSTELLLELREQYFGDPHKNGSAWVVDQLEEMLDN